MNTFYAQHRAVARIWAALTMCALLLSAFSAPISAFAEEVPTEPVVEQTDTTTDEDLDDGTQGDGGTEDGTDPSLLDEAGEEDLFRFSVRGNPLVGFCHANNGNHEDGPFSADAAAPQALLNGHEDHPNDIIPIIDGLPNGKNLTTVYDEFGGLTGQQILDKNCDIPKPKKEAKISITKIMCEDESLLPNDGYTAITKDTAADFLAQNPSCYPVEGWKFQWAKDGQSPQSSPDNMGELNSPWKTSDETDKNGNVVITLDDKTVKNKPVISVREVWSPGYIPFTGQNGGNVSAELYCAQDATNFDNLEWISGVQVDNTYHCVAWNVPVLENVEVCKFDAQQVPQEGWKMTISNGETNKVGYTEKDGCVDFKVNPFEGPWTVTEEVKKDWVLQSVQAAFGITEASGDGEAHDSCVFFVGGIIDGGEGDGNSNTAIIVENPEFKCTFQNEFIPPCEDKPNGDWASSVVDSDQKLRKNGSAITDPNRTDDTKVLGAADWVNNGSTGFFSLGFGGSVTVEFENYVPNVAGDDIAVHEATNGGYPAETALVEVSQDGSTWKSVGSATNQGVGKISYFDFASTGYLWIKYVRVTDTTNAALHANDADGFDVDAIKATKTVCEEPEAPKVCKVTIVSDETNTVVEKSAFAKLVSWIHPDWDAIVNAPSEWIWGDDPVVDPVGETNQTFLKKFGWNGPVTSAILTIAADNSYNVTVNGDVFGGDATEKNFITADVHDLTSFIDQGNNELEIAVKNWPLANGTTETNPAGLKYELVITGTDAECDIPYEEPEEKVATIVAHKIVCSDEADLPNWGAVEGYTITPTTAADWVANPDNASCKFESGWQFQWAPQNTSNPDNNLPASALYGAAGGNWTTFDEPTDVYGKTTVTLTESQISGMSNIWMREVLKPGYIPFTYGPTNMTNEDDYTAEMYCHTDVFNYDNYDRVDGIAVDNTYHCVAWNHIPEPAPICDASVNLLANGGFEEPEVTDGAGWDIFDLTTYPALAWAVDWINGTDAPAEASLELHGGVNGWNPAGGAQHAELDSDWQGPGGASGEAASVAISQTVDTIAGKDYSLSWSFSPRPNTSEYENKLEVWVNNALVETNQAAGGSNTTWTADNYVFTGTGAPVTITFKDAGLNNSQGTFLDNVSLNCREPENGGGNNGDNTYRIEGYVWNDDNENSEWEKIEYDSLQIQEFIEIYGEVPLGGWVVEASNGEATYSTTTDEYGYYYFDVPAGTWTISQEVQSGWEQTTEPDEYVVTVPMNNSAQSLFERVLAYVVPVAHAALLDTYGDYNFGNNFVGTTPNPTTNGGGGGGGGYGGPALLRTPNPTPTTAGVSDGAGGDFVTPGMVLGEQVSVVPYGAPGTGHGGTSVPSGYLSLLQLLALSRRGVEVK